MSTTGYVVSKVGDRKWGVYFRVSAAVSFGPKATYPTKRAAERNAAHRARMDAAIASGTE